MCSVLGNTAKFKSNAVESIRTEFNHGLVNYITLFNFSDDFTDDSYLISLIFYR